MGDWRLLVTEPADGATNMATDEALWQGRRAGTSPPTLRFFGWDPPTVSLGYGQPLEAGVDVDAARALGVGLVRRPTGGSALYHDGPERELTYAVTASADDLGTSADLMDTYAWVARALLRGLRALGADAVLAPAPPAGGPIPAFCFARSGRHEIEVGGRKLVGSAQRRQGRTFLQHGALLLDVDVDRLRRLFPTTPDPAAPLTTLATVLGRRPPFEEVATTLARAFEEEHDLVLIAGGLDADEAARVDTLARVRYRDPAFLAGPS